MSSASAELRKESKAQAAQADVIQEVEKLVSTLVGTLDLLRQFHEDNPSSAFTDAGLAAVLTAHNANGITLTAVADSDMRDTVGKGRERRGE